MCMCVMMDVDMHFSLKPHPEAYISLPYSCTVVLWLLYYLLSPLTLFSSASLPKLHLLLSFSGSTAISPVSFVSLWAFLFVTANCFSGLLSNLHDWHCCCSFSCSCYHRCWFCYLMKNLKNSVTFLCPPFGSNTNCIFRMIQLSDTDCCSICKEIESITPINERKHKKNIQLIKNIPVLRSELANLAAEKLVRQTKIPTHAALGGRLWISWCCRNITFFVCCHIVS